MLAFQKFLSDNWSWLGPVIPILLQELLAASPLKSNSFGQLLLSLIQKLLPAPKA